jgi:hypothetical protein
VFWISIVFFGPLKLHLSQFGHAALLLGFVGLGLGVLALWLLLLRRFAGAVICMVFYGIQLISVTLPSGERIGFNSLPTVYYRVYGSSDAPISLNVVSLVLFAFSIALWTAYRQRRVPGVAVTPNKSLERTREG